ncbi:hypothetical protein L227DRAFT_560997 [Lentinus tigrinus ALCF2SS1-6]|uniref:Uncharacterized protein n=1 Tax=Lentinus tigrinus ALCF2SS1-6 TaxID=1328759 RepID=A0A5C2SLX0_9APHY|nr:hypothetical protein L227DRAFT_560997 [Lentinus tigrinus ALCF2SS1-6]
MCQNRKDVIVQHKMLHTGGPRLCPAMPLVPLESDNSPPSNGTKYMADCYKLQGLSSDFRKLKTSMHLQALVNNFAKVFILCALLDFRLRTSIQSLTLIWIYIDLDSQIQIIADPDPGFQVTTCNGSDLLLSLKKDNMTVRTSRTPKGSPKSDSAWEVKTLAKLLTNARRYIDVFNLQKSDKRLWSLYWSKLRIRESSRELGTETRTEVGGQRSEDLYTKVRMSDRSRDRRQTAEMTEQKHINWTNDRAGVGSDQSLSGSPNKAGGKGAGVMKY